MPIARRSARTIRKVVDTMNSLAAVRHYIGDQAGAMQYYHDALPLFRKLYGNVHPNVSTVLNNYGRLELEQFHIAAALPLLKESVEIDRQLGRAEHDDFVFSLSNLALAYRGRAALRVLEDLTPQKIEEAIEHIVRTKVNAGQLDAGAAYAAADRAGQGRVHDRVERDVPQPHRLSGVQWRH